MSRERGAGSGTARCASSRRAAYASHVVRQRLATIRGATRTPTTRGGRGGPGAGGAGGARGGPRGAGGGGNGAPGAGAPRRSRVTGGGETGGGAGAPQGDEARAGARAREQEFERAYLVPAIARR